MDDTQFGSKQQLVELIRNVVRAEETGLVSILTNTNHAVILKFFQGRLIHLHSRTREIEDVVQVLNESSWVKFKFASVTMENRPEFMPVETFLQLIETGNGENVSTDSSSTIPSPDIVSNVAGNNRDIEPLSQLLVKIASEYVGPIADMLVDEAFENVSDPARAIDYIADMIPDSNQAETFRAAARKATQLISL